MDSPTKVSLGKTSSTPMSKSPEIKIPATVPSSEAEEKDDISGFDGEVQKVAD